MQWSASPHFWSVLTNSQDEVLFLFYKIRQTLSSQIKVKRSKFIQGEKWRKKADVRLMCVACCVIQF